MYLNASPTVSEKATSDCFAYFSRQSYHTPAAKLKRTTSVSTAWHWG